MTNYLHADELDLPSLPPPPRRRCANHRCRVWLARDNFGDLCGPCEAVDREETALRLFSERTDRG